MTTLSLTSLHNLIKKSRRLPLIVLGVILILAIAWPLLKKGLLSLAYAWEARKPTAQTYLDPLAPNQDFTKSALKPEQWKFDSRLSFTIQPYYTYKGGIDTTFSLSEEEQTELRRSLGLTEKEQMIQNGANLVWYETGFYFTLNPEAHSLSFSTSLNLKPDLIEKGNTPDQKTALEEAKKFFTQTIPVPHLISTAAHEVDYLAFDKNRGYSLTQESSEAAVTLVIFYPQVGDRKILSSQSFIQIGFAKDNKVVLFDFNPQVFAPQSVRAFSKSASEIKKAVRANSGYFDLSCRDLSDISEARLKNPQESLVYNVEDGFVTPVVIFEVQIKSNDGTECSGKFILPALKDKYYE